MTINIMSRQTVIQLFVFGVISTSVAGNFTYWENNEEIKLFREYLRIPSVHPDIDYEPSINFVARQLESLQLPYRIHYAGGDIKKPIIVGTWLGTQPELPSIMLATHMDVVPVFEDKWTHPPFAADMDAEGRIFARGAQDMKSVGMQYLAALRAMRKTQTQIRRTVHVAFIPDEEIGGETGMLPFVNSQEFRDMNVGFALNEGMTTDNNFAAYYAEKTIWQINFKITGSAGHGSVLLPNTAGQKLSYLLDKLMAYRSTQQQLLDQDPSLQVGDVSTINLTKLKGGVQTNVVPPVLEACFDMRLAIGLNLTEFEEQLQRWCTEAGGDIEWEWLGRYAAAPATKVDGTNPYWVAFENAFNEMNITLETHVLTGGTDSYYLREIGIQAIGFSPMNNTPTLAHDHDEFLQADVYLRGIEIYHQIFKSLFNC